MSVLFLGEYESVYAAATKPEIHKKVVKITCISEWMGKAVQRMCFWFILRH